MMLNYPISPMVGSALGVSYSSLSTIGAIYPSSGFGQAKLRCYPNLGSGNTVLFDIDTTVRELTGPIPLGLVYNSQSPDLRQAWQWQVPRLVLPPNGTVAILSEGDGHITTYTYHSDRHDKADACYLAPAWAEGRARLWMDKKLQQWIWQHPKTGEKRFYNEESGQLVAVEDQKGRRTTYEYRSDGRLSAVQGFQGNRYELRESADKKSVALWLVEGNQQTLHRRWLFDDVGRLSQSETADGYTVKYIPNQLQNAKFSAAESYH